MSTGSHSTPARISSRALRAVLACALAAAALGALAAQAGAARGASPARGPATASLAQCLTATAESERAATFAGEMSALPGAARMEIRIDVLERLPGEEAFHVVTAPGLGVWRASQPGVKVFKYLKQVTNLSAPADYRASVRFRWLSSRSRTIRGQVLHTPLCEQTAPAEAPPGSVAPPAGE